MTATHISQRIRAPRAAVYRALLDPQMIAQWRVPDGMTGQIHQFEAKEGGFFRVSLTYDLPTDTGKTTAQTDTYHGRFLELVPDERIVETVEFETADPGMMGEMTITTVLVEMDGETELRASHEGLPSALSASDNEIGWRMSLGKLAALLEGAQQTPA